MLLNVGELSVFGLLYTFGNDDRIFSRYSDFNKTEKSFIDILNSSRPPEGRSRWSLCHGKVLTNKKNKVASAQ
jgi:hypothetical protein